MFAPVVFFPDLDRTIHTPSCGAGTPYIVRMLAYLPVRGKYGRHDSNGSDARYDSDGNGNNKQQHA